LPVDTVLRNARVVVRGRIVEAGLAIDEGRVFRIAKKTNLPQASKKINLKGNVILPGLIDSHVHLRNRQLAYKEDFFSGTAAAAAGGVTLVIDMPNNKPVTMDSISLKERMKLAERRAVVNVAFYSAFPQNLKEISSIVKEGAVAFKLYMSKQVGGLDISDYELLLQAFNTVAEKEVPVAVHAEDRGILETERRKMEKTGHKDVETYAKARPPEAEAQSIRQIAQLAKKSGVAIHFCHVSSTIGLNAFLAAKKDGLHVTCEVTPHHLLLYLKHLKTYGTLAITNPPLRTNKDVISLWRALKQGFIDTIASDHAPHAIEEKEVESIWEAKPGIPGLETTLPLLLTEVSEGRLPIADLIRLTSEKPASIFNLKNRGSLAEGNWADLAVVDLKRKYRINSSNFHSKAKYSPFDRWTVKGKVTKTFVEGRIVMDDDEIVAKPGTSQTIRRTRINHQ
jgi:dihydroorotase